MRFSCLWKLVFKDGVTVRSIFALATPLVPLLLLIACGFLEFFSRGLGDFVAIDRVQFAAMSIWLSTIFNDCFRHPHGAEDAHGAVYWWRLR